MLVMVDEFSSSDPTRILRCERELEMFWRLQDVEKRGAAFGEDFDGDGFAKARL